MKQFFGAFFGSCLGILITGVVMIIIVIASLTSVFSEAVKMNDNEVYKQK
jgi:hypothetical protein